MTRLAAKAGYGLLGAGSALIGLLVSRGCAGGCNACFGCASAGGLLGGWLLLRHLWGRLHPARAGQPGPVGAAGVSRVLRPPDQDRRSEDSPRHCDAGSWRTEGN